MSDYNEMQKRLTLMYDREWMKTIQLLKEFEYEEDKRYRIVYQQEKQRKTDHLTLTVFNL